MGTSADRPGNTQSQLVVYLPGGHWVHSLMTSLEEESIYVPKGHGRKRENSW